MPIELPYNFQNLDTSGLQNATDSGGDVIGKALPASYLDANFQKLAQVVHVGTSPPSSPYEGMVWLDTVNGVIKQYDGTQWVSKVSVADTATSAGNADTVDGYHASQTPNANTIPVAGSDGKLASGWLPSISGGSGSVVFTSSGSWTVPQGVTSVLILAIGGGGGGGGVQGSGYKAAGGGLGGQVQFVKRTVSSGEQLTITVGSGGSGGSSSGGNGGTGGTTSVVGSVSGSLVSSSGGAGGGGLSGNNLYYLSTVGVKGMISQIRYYYGDPPTEYIALFVEGGNGISVLGSGGLGGYFFDYGFGGTTSSPNGGNASGYGCGGGGAMMSGTGGSGSAGLVVIWY